MKRKVERVARKINLAKMEVKGVKVQINQKKTVVTAVAIVVKVARKRKIRVTILAKRAIVHQKAGIVVVMMEKVAEKQKVQRNQRKRKIQSQ